jgi:hypothetical protein
MGEKSRKKGVRNSMTNSNETSPVLLLAFNRPDKMLKLFEVLRMVKPRHLFVAIDGPRDNNPDDKEKVMQVRQIIGSIDWPCSVAKMYHDRNLGCKLAVSRAITWFFDNVEEGVILEDDCIPSPDFFRYASELLKHYRDDERIMTIAAQHFHRNMHRPKYSYFFSRYNHCWGWASWRRAWKLYDKDMSLWPVLRDTDWLLGIGNGSRTFQRYWTNIFDKVHAGDVDSWAYRWTFSSWVQNGLCILPARNLVVNIGFDDCSTHTKKDVPEEWTLQLEKMIFPLEHPIGMVRDVMADEWTDRHIFKITRSLGKNQIKNFITKISSFVIRGNIKQ